MSFTFELSWHLSCYGIETDLNYNLTGWWSCTKEGLTLFFPQNYFITASLLKNKCMIVVAFAHNYVLSFTSGRNSWCGMISKSVSVLVFTVSLMWVFCAVNEDTAWSMTFYYNISAFSYSIMFYLCHHN